MTTLSAEQIRTFGVVADAFVPALDGETVLWRSSASELGVRRRIVDLFARLPDDHARRDLSRLLTLLDHPAGGLLLHGRARPFSSLPMREAEAALLRMAGSRLPQARQAYQVLKRLTAYLTVTPPPGRSDWPLWADLGYPGPDGPPPDVPKPIVPRPVAGDQIWSADVVVVGSGAGGATAAAVLAQAGLDVVVLERGGYHNEADFTHVESEAYASMYLDGALGTTRDRSIGLLAGSTLGGGTVVNYSTSFATPAAVREEWDRVAGFDRVFTGAAYEQSARSVQTRLQVNRDHNPPAPRDQLMDKALRSLGWHVDAMPRNVVGCRPEACGYCTMGCRHGAKQSALLTWLADAATAGATIAVNADVRRVLTTNGVATGVEADVGGAHLTVRAGTVVLAAGALHTPALLLRSGLGGPAVGRHLRLHPVTAVFGRFEEPVDAWTGTMQALYCDQFADLDGGGYGFKFETAPAHPVLPAMLLGWAGPVQFKELLHQYRHWTPLGVLLRDRDAGRVRIRPDGSPVWSYRLSRRDTAHLREGVYRAAQALAEAGAVEIMAPTAVPVVWHPHRGERLDSFQARVDSAGYGPNQLAYLSFHQMGSARMGGDPAAAVVDAENQVHGTTGLTVMDASCFPTASGVNPMISIEAIAHRGASALAGRLVR